MRSHAEVQRSEQALKKKVRELEARLEQQTHQPALASSSASCDAQGTARSHDGHRPDRSEFDDRIDELNSWCHQNVATADDLIATFSLGTLEEAIRTRSTRPTDLPRRPPPPGTLLGPHS